MHESKVCGNTRKHSRFGVRIAMGILRYIRGNLRIRITGACVEKFLNQLAEKNISFWDLEREDALHYSMNIYKKSLSKIEDIGIRNFCSIEVLKQSTLSTWLRKSRKRPILILGVFAAIVVSFSAQGIVLAIDIEGNETLHEEEILRALEKLDIEIGSSSQIDQQLTKHRMLNLLPELSWIGVNRSGFKLNVLITERDLASSNRPNYPAGNIIAIRDCVITEMLVSEGMPLCKVGDTVKEGQIMVSGFEDYGLILKGVCAEAEIYGQTWYSGMLVMPIQRSIKQYTGKEWTQYTLIIGRKRINLSGNSRISDTTCDKMISVAELSVPGYPFPVALETVTYREYEIVSDRVAPNVAQEQLEAAWQQLIRSQMIAGQIETTEVSLIESGGLYILQAKSTCNEMVARLYPMDLVYEGETND